MQTTKAQVRTISFSVRFTLVGSLHDMTYEQTAEANIRTQHALVDILMKVLLPCVFGAGRIDLCLDYITDILSCPQHV